jgi:MFS family permease
VPNSKNNFILLTASRLISTLGSYIFSFALSLYVLDITGSAAIFSAVLALSFIPGVLVNLFGGVLVDRHDKKKIIILSDALSGIVMLFFILSLKINPVSIAAIIIFDIFISILQSYNNLAILAALPNIVSDKNLVQANSVIQVIPTLLMIIGPVLGAILYNRIGIQQITILNAFSFFLSAILILFIIPDKQQQQMEKGLKNNYYLDLKEAIQYLKHNYLLRFVMFIAVIINLISSPMILLVMPFINYRIIKISGLQLSFIEAAWGIGGMLGGIYLSMKKNTDRLIRNLFMLLIAQSALMILWAFPAFPALIEINKNTITLIFCILLITIGLLNMILYVPVFTYFQQQTPAHLRGKILGFINASCLLAIPVGMWVFGMLLEAVPWYYVTSVSGLVMVLFCFFSGRNKHFVTFCKSLTAKTE